MSTLYIVATPIGNLKDITYRAIETLQSVDFIACEDTRHSGILLKHFEIKKPLLSYHAHSKGDRENHILTRIMNGESCAYISDAGTPGISDPGGLLVKEALLLGIPVVPIPGASAFLTCLMASGLPIHEFRYIGFLPMKKGRQTVFQSLTEEPLTTVCYESPHRFLKTLSELMEHTGKERHIVIGRELTKMFEEFFRGSVEEAYVHFSKKKIQGEFVIILSGKEKKSRKEEREEK